MKKKTVKKNVSKSPIAHKKPVVHTKILGNSPLSHNLSSPLQLSSKAEASKSVISDSGLLSSRVRLETDQPLTELQLSEIKSELLKVVTSLQVDLACANDNLRAILHPLRSQVKPSQG